MILNHSSIWMPNMKQLTLDKSLKHKLICPQVNAKNSVICYANFLDFSMVLYVHTKVHLELKEGAQPIHQRAYPVPDANLNAFKKELNHLCEIGVLELCGPSGWASPTFIIPKKDGRVRWVSDFRALNKVLKRKNLSYSSNSWITKQAKGI